MVDCRNCEFGGRPSYEWPCNICTDGSAFKQKPKPTTNADRIRAMSDEELASKLCDDNCPPGYRDALVCGKSGFNCEECWLNWLQSPADGGGGE